MARAHGQHLQLAAGQGAGPLLLPLPQPGEHGIGPFGIRFDPGFILAQVSPQI